MRRYATPLAFKEALECRLRAATGETGRDQNRLRMLRVYPLETHQAEKLHAYTVPRNPFGTVRKQRESMEKYVFYTSPSAGVRI